MVRQRDVHGEKPGKQEEGKNTHLGVLVGGLLPLPGHGAWWWAGEHVDDVEEAERDGQQLHHLDEDPPALTLGGLRAGAVRAKSNPVG